MLKSFDLFADPFKFEVQGSSRGQKTRCGGIYSILVMMAILSYLG